MKTTTTNHDNFERIRIPWCRTNMKNDWNVESHEWENPYQFFFLTWKSIVAHSNLTSYKNWTGFFCKFSILSIRCDVLKVFQLIMSESNGTLPTMITEKKRRYTSARRDSCKRWCSTDTQTHRHTDIQTHRHTGHAITQTHRHTDTQTHGHTDTQTETQLQDTRHKKQDTDTSTDALESWLEF